MGYGFGVGGFGMGWGMLLLLVLVLACLWAVSGGYAKGGGRSALDILKERYARGEITKQEFEDKKRDIA